MKYRLYKFYNNKQYPIYYNKSPIDDSWFIYNTTNQLKRLKTYSLKEMRRIIILRNLKFNCKIIESHVIKNWYEID